MIIKGKSHTSGL